MSDEKILIEDSARSSPGIQRLLHGRGGFFLVSPFFGIMARDFPLLGVINTRLSTVLKNFHHTSESNLSYAIFHITIGPRCCR